ncbi:transcription factor Spi-B isoform X2 [Hemibagrus wyckioides]|uniref:transcription factor Spi-B isoform X2 n=1 Tax=Hemibagrus wyckioides TaxID=337641 RepID=UPI00266D5931|nr:transcription factor Spi-B isoform X2 [Hemibagrus wyckioides]
MNMPQSYQTDLEVILEFLEEHCRQETRGQWENATADFHTNHQILGDDYGVLSHHVDSLQLLSSTKAQQATGPQVKETGLDSAEIRESIEEALNLPAGEESPLGQPEESAQSSPSSTPAGRGKKLRLFHFLFEMLEDPGMAHCLSWVPASVGVFRFSSTYKEHVAALWGQRKGNRRPMTYQKMSRALRNYTRSGEIIKVRKKLTYQFSGATLTTLRSQQRMKNT